MSAKDVTKGTIKLFYNKLRDQRGLSVTTIDGLHTVIRQVFAYAVDERYILANPAEGAITELKRESPKRQAHPALTKAEQDRFLNYIESAPQYRHWLNIFKVFIGTGMRVSELTGLRWKDVSFEEKTISVNHGLAYYKDEETGKMSYQVGKPKTKASRRKIVVIDDVLDALKAEKAYQQEMGIVCQDTVKGNASADETFYTDFIFLNKDGHVFNQNTLNKAIRRISRDANAEATDDESLSMLPKFSCHCFRSTFITRSAEVLMPIQVIMRQVGHDDIDTTMKIYTTVNPDWQQRELAALQGMFK